jgi:hypothetical protein
LQPQLSPGQRRCPLSREDALQPEQEPVTHAPNRSNRCLGFVVCASNRHPQGEGNAVQTPSSRMKGTQTDLARGSVGSPQDSKGQDLGGHAVTY